MIISPKLKLTFVLFFLLFLKYSPNYASDIPRLIFFYSPNCKACIQVKNELIPKIEKEFKNKIKVGYHDISNIENYKLLLGLKERHKLGTKISVPTCYFKGRFFVGKKDISENLKTFIAASLEAIHREEILLEIDLIKHFKTFTPLVIISLGLVDGINPCAFTVIVFFMSFLAVQGYRKRELSFIGITFIFSVFLAYLLMGVGLFAFLYRLKGFWYITKVFNFSIGIFSIIMGVLALYDFYIYQKTRQTEGLLLQLPKPIKNRIHYVIGLHYRNGGTKDKNKTKRGFLSLILSASITGFLVSLLEAVCTGQTYLPTISFVLKTSHLKLQALIYLLLYNFMFIVPLFIIFFFALLGVSSEQFSKFLKKRLSVIKLLMAGLFFGLGIFLIWKV